MQQKLHFLIIKVKLLNYYKLHKPHLQECSAKDTRNHFREWKWLDLIISE